MSLDLKFHTKTWIIYEESWINFQLAQSTICDSLNTTSKHNVSSK